MGRLDSVSRSIRAASVMAAGSVMNEPSSGTIARKPKTTSTSPGSCDGPAWRRRGCASCSKYLVEKVCRTASRNGTAPVA
jgi:hypothetical protein